MADHDRGKRHAALTSAIDDLILQLRSGEDDAMQAAGAGLRALLRGDDARLVREEVERRLKGELLEVQWELEEALEETAPKKAAPPAPPPEPEPEPEPEPDPNAPLRPEDLVPVYDDPRGLVLYKTRTGDRWVATQVDPRTGQPQTFELMPHEISQLKMQLEGSPYWIVGG
jgi:hypothetical protein